MNRTLMALLVVCVPGCAASLAEDVGQAEASLTSVTQVVDTTAGKVVANAQGLSLYTFDNDTTGASTCYNGCATTWPALVVDAQIAEKLTAPFGVTTRTDGAKQVTLSGHPLYRFKNDAVQGDIKGDGLGTVWHLARPVKPEVMVADSPVGKILTNAEGLSLYTFDDDTSPESTCYEGCAEVWPPLVTTNPGVHVAPFGTTVRLDGTHQIAIHGHPLYTFAADSAPGDLHGDGLGGVWHLARPNKR